LGGQEHPATTRPEAEGSIPSGKLRLPSAKGLPKKDNTKNMLNTLLSSGLPKLTSFGVRVGLSISLFASACCAFAQINLVPNWSFEDTANCGIPVSSQILRSPPWFSANNATPDVYSMDAGNACGIYMDTTDVIGQWCYQAPFHGQRFAGEYLWKYGDEVKDYIEVELISALVGGHSYRASMEISLPECWQYAVNTMGAYFSVDSVFDPNPGTPGVLPVTPQAEFHEPLFFKDDSAWMHVEDVFVADGGERFMVIGSFTDNAGTDVQYHPAQFGAAYYYFDAIEVKDVTSWESVAEDLQVYQPAPGFLSVRWPGFPRVDRITIMNGLGSVILERSFQGDTEGAVPLTDLPGGVYVVRAWLGKRQATARWIWMR